jgi:tRNA-splicing ligase RtcB
MNTSDIKEVGIHNHLLQRMVGPLCGRLHGEGHGKGDMKKLFSSVIEDPEEWSGHKILGEFAEKVIEFEETGPRDEAVNYSVFGAEGIDHNAKEQMEVACKLPVAVRGAMMPDAHLGYGLPVGGVLGTKGAVIPWAVGVDIACRMRLTIFDFMPSSEGAGILAFCGENDSFNKKLSKAIEEETRFGKGAHFKPEHQRDHEVLYEDWNVSPVTRKYKETGIAQLGSSGGGNHFVEFGWVTSPELTGSRRPHLALLSHSGSRGPGYKVANHYSEVAEQMNPQLPKWMKAMSWLDMDSAEGQEYWAAMQLMGRYAAANHECIHRHIASRMGLSPIEVVENHHNFAWKEEHDGEELIVHRKGATPANEGELGIIPATMVDEAKIVSGKREASSLRSAAHGAGRVMSRTEGRNTFSWSDVNKQLDEKGVTLLSAGLDESPGVYKDIDEVMSHQEDLVETIGGFQPVIVKMADD